MTAPPIPSPDKQLCPHCQSEVEISAVHCPHCGFALRGEPRWISFLRFVAMIIMTFAAAILGAWGACLLLSSGVNDAIQKNSGNSERLWGISMLLVAALLTGGVMLLQKTRKR